MPVDKNATHYEPGNGRFDLMTDEEVKAITSDDIMLIYMAVSHMDNTPGSSFELANKLHELHLRFLDSDFRLEILPKE